MVPVSLGMKMEVDVEYFIVVVGNSFGSSTARCQANNDLKNTGTDKTRKVKVKLHKNVRTN